jgi:hypothetical protein
MGGFTIKGKIEMLDTYACKRVGVIKALVNTAFPDASSTRSTMVAGKF